MVGTGLMGLSFDDARIKGYSRVSKFNQSISNERHSLQLFKVQDE